MGNKAKYAALSKNTALFTINSFGSKMISFFMVPLYTYVLSADDFGTADLITSTASLLIPILTLNIQEAALRFSLDEEKDRTAVISICMKINVFGGILLAAALCFLEWQGILNLERHYYCFLFVSYFFGGIYNSFSMYIKALDKVGVLVVSGIVSTLTSCLLNLALLLILDAGINGYLIANSAGTGIAILIMFFGGGIYKDYRTGMDICLAKEMALYCFPLAFNGVAWWVNNASDKYMLAFFCGVTANGIFSVSYKIPTILSTLQGVFYNAWSISAITEFDKKDSDGFIGNIYLLYSCVSTVGCSGILICNIFIAKILYAKEFFAAWEYVPFLLFGAVFNGLALFEGCLYSAVKKTKEVFYTTLIGAAVNIIANFIFVQTLGPVGAAFATLLGYAAIWILRTRGLFSFIKMKVDWKRQFLILAVLFIQTLLALKRNTELIQAICLCLILFFQKNEIQKVARKVMKRGLL